MQTGIFRTVTLILLTVMSIRNSIGQTILNNGDHFFDINVCRVNGDSPRMATVVYKNGGPLYVVQMVEGKILTFSVDGRNIPADSLGRYQSAIDEIRDRIKEAEEQAKRDRAQAERDREQAGRDREQADRDRQQSDRDRQQAERDRQQAMLDRDQADRNREQAERERQQALRNRGQADQDREQADRDRQQAERDREQAGRDRVQAVRDREQAERDRIRAEEDRKLMDSLIRDLVADGIVPDRDSVHSLKLNADEIIVNGKRLPEAMEKKYISKYVKKGSSVSFERN
jgi:hypothetical protein